MNSKAHVSLDVENLEKSIEFYSVLFDTTPTKVRPKYAKFDLDEPSLNLTMNERAACCIQGLSHMGIRVDSIEQVLAAKSRLEAAGFKTSDEMGTTCCYAVQDKIWAKDPSGIRWEVYLFKSDAETANAPAANAEPCCAK
ncbi:MAG: glyoxalase/bleomycin resistance/dioxygenase family protein [Candidatus Angelobacter sp.]|jgi:predicted enzyme related to lactoylglutathione lyase|nr:glyoxalase/bleomycin resistance/dioxygenase family protein [Candidatus Angelobacter sp.]